MKKTTQSATCQATPQPFISATRIARFWNQNTFLHWELPHYKEYLRFPLITLPKRDQRLMGAVGQCIQTRRTPLRFRKSALAAKELSTMLAYSVGLARTAPQSRELRVYPSAGAKYPIETYVVVLRGRELASGLYHYAVRDHGLRFLLAGDLTTDMARLLGDDPRILSANCVIVLTASFGRTLEKYGQRGLRYIFLEAGHIGQNFCLSAAALGLGCLPIGGFIDDQVSSLLDINAEAEFPCYLLVIGKKGAGHL